MAAACGHRHLDDVPSQRLCHCLKVLDAGQSVASGGCCFGCPNVRWGKGAAWTFLFRHGKKDVGLPLYISADVAGNRTWSITRYQAGDRIGMPRFAAKTGELL